MVYMIIPCITKVSMMRRYIGGILRFNTGKGG